MRLSVIGSVEDAIGFALAGWPGTVCTSAAAVAVALEADCKDPDIALVLMSGPAAHLAPDDVRRWQAAPDAPIVIVLPGDGRPGPEREEAPQ